MNGQKLANVELSLSQNWFGMESTLYTLMVHLPVDIPLVPNM